MKSSIRRLAKDQVALRKSLPPNYFFEDTDDSQSLPDDLSQLIICLTGPEGTPYSQGVWYIRLDIPVGYPQSPPTATFKTRIFHPNVAEETGAVCLETLKRDWDSKLNLKDILITISCLLIQPNPDSALNQKAGALIQEDYDAFARQARLMTRIHAPIPTKLFNLAQEAKRRGEDAGDCSSQMIPPIPNIEGSEPRSSVLKESQPAIDVDSNKAGDDRKAKRTLSDVCESTDMSRKEENIDTRPKKSPKHDHQPEHCLDRKDVMNRDHRNTVEKHQQPSNSASLPPKVIFRAQWSIAAGGLKTKARVGIRRL